MKRKLALIFSILLVLFSILIFAKKSFGGACEDWLIECLAYCWDNQVYLDPQQCINDCTEQYAKICLN